jgi:hypothetical protein
MVMQVRHLWLVAYFIVGLSGGSAPATAQLAQDMKLEDAGFVMRPADTAQELVRAIRAGLPQLYVVGPGSVSVEREMIYDMDANGPGVPEGDIPGYEF